MPLAIARRRADELPLTLTLDDSMAMQPQLKLSAFERVVVGARISRSGNATPQSGDLEGQSTPVAPSGRAAVTIERARP
jgi:cytochrome c-type biogenesis protein CcmH